MPRELSTFSGCGKGGLDMANTKTLERRAEFLAEKFGLSLQLTRIWVEQNPEKARRPMLPSHVADLERRAKV